MTINKIVIVGGGSAGWMTASTLIKAFPNKDISVIESKNIPLVGVGESTLGGIRRWTRFIGLKEEDFFESTDASYKMSIKFTDFYKKDAGGFQYPFGKPVVDGERNPFYDWHVKKFCYPDTPVTDFVDCLFPASALWNENKYSENNFGDYDNFDPNNDVAYHFDAVKFGHWLRDTICVPNGVHHIPALVEHVEGDAERGIEYLTLDNGYTVHADLFIDCTGFRSILLDKTLKEPFKPFNDIIPNNGAWATRIPYKDKEKEIEPFTNSTAIGNGWCWNIPLYSRLGAGYVHSTKFITKDEALEEFKEYLTSDKMVVPRTREEVDQLEYRYIDMRIGIHERTFVKNVCAIGLAAGFIEPLESNGLYSVHEFLFKLVDILERNDISQFDRDMYNSSTRQMFEGFARFVSLHYLLSHRDDTEYWRDIKNGVLADNPSEMYSPYVFKAQGFYDLAYRYLDAWAHPLGNAGISYIATGMNLNMMNSARAEQDAFISGVDPYAIANQAANIWEYRKAKWRRNAENAPSLHQYLKARFFQNRD
jgi:tryptophan halogenase